MRPVADPDHPLNRVRLARGWKVAVMMRRIGAQHEALGFGQFGGRPEKWSRWTRPGRAEVPELETQLAIAALVGVSPRAVRQPGAWPGWLNYAIPDCHPAAELPWTPAGTIEALAHTAAGGPVKRRGLIHAAAGGTLAAILAQWAIADPATAAAQPGCRVETDVADAVDGRLAALRVLDDRVGAVHVYDAALTECRLLSGILRTTSYSTATQRRLYASASEAARIAGWCAYDMGDAITAEQHLRASMQAAASAADVTAGALTAAFWANVRYTHGDPAGALVLTGRALSRADAITSPRVLAMLHIRTARAHSLRGEAAPAYRAIDAALATYERGMPVEQDRPAVYWMNTGEVFQAAGSAALSLGEPARAVTYFDAARTHPDPYQPTLESRGAAIYAARLAQAQLDLGNRDAAIHAGADAAALADGVTSDRSTHALDQLTPYRDLPDISTLLHTLRA
jgi:tetratricopeptide (TPR) repeat protein